MQPNVQLAHRELQDLGDEICQIRDRVAEIQLALATHSGEESSLHYRASEAAASLQRLIWEFERQIPRVRSASA